MLSNFLSAFIPIFVAVDAIGVLPIFIALTQDFDKKEKTRIIGQSIITALFLAVGFIFLGGFVFKALNITVGDFMVAGGTILFSIAIRDIVRSEGKYANYDSQLGAVPLGTPLIVGPAVMTTSLIVMSEHGWQVTLTSIVVNVLLVGIIFSFSDILFKILGRSSMRVLSKITSLLLAAIAVMLIRKGIFYLYNTRHTFIL